MSTRKKKTFTPHGTSLLLSLLLKQGEPKSIMSNVVLNIQYAQQMYKMTLIMSEQVVASPPTCMQKQDVRPSWLNVQICTEY